MSESTNEVAQNQVVRLRSTTGYNPRFAPEGAKKAYVAKITGRASGPVKYERQFLGTAFEAQQGDEGLYERQNADKKGRPTRFYHVLLWHDVYGLMCSEDCEDDVPRIAKMLDDGISIADAVEPIDIRPSDEMEGLWIFDVVTRTPSAAKKAAVAATVDEAVSRCVEILSHLDATAKRAALAELKAKLA